MFQVFGRRWRSIGYRKNQTPKHKANSTISHETYISHIADSAESIVKFRKVRGSVNDLKKKYVLRSGDYGKKTVKYIVMFVNLPQPMARAD